MSLISVLFLEEKSINKNTRTLRLTILATLIAIASNTNAQQIVADAITVHVPTDTILNTGTAGGSAGYGMWALNGGNIIADGPFSIVTGGSGSYGVVAATGSSIDMLYGGTINSSSVGLSLTGNSQISADGLTITTAGSNASAYVISGHLTLKNSTVNSTRFALYATNASAIIDATDVILETTGNNNQAIEAYNGGTITLNSLTTGNKISTSGNVSHGIIAHVLGSKINSTGLLNISTQGSTAYGVYAFNSGVISLDGAQINTAGGNANGILVNTNGVTTATNTNIQTMGDSALGIDAEGAGSSITMTGGSVTTQGLNALGSQAINGGHLDLNNISITTNGDGAYGLYTKTGSSITANNVEIVTHGLNSHAIFSDSLGAVDITQTSGTLQSDQGSSLYTLGGIINASLDQTTIVNNGSLIRALNDGASNISHVSLIANNMTIGGDIEADAGSIANVTLKNSTWNGSASNAGLVSLDSVSTWNMSSSSDIAQVNNSGLINFFSPAVGDVLTVHGNYTSNNGNITFNSLLGDDNSSSDKLIIDGDVSGNTGVNVTNAGGTGAATINGIRLIQVNGDSSNGDFVQNSRIVAGAYDYNLTRGIGTNIGNWYLVSNLNLQPPVEPPVEPPVNPPVNPPVEPPVNPPVEPPVVSPIPEQMIERPEVGSYIANLAAANNMFVTRLHDRLGETQYIDVLTGEKKVTSLWLRNEGRHNRSRDDSGQLKTQDNRYVLQLGGDIAQWSNNGLDRIHLGLMTGYGNSNSTTDSQVTGYNSKGSVVGYNIGLYSTWYANDADKSGFYLDGWMQYSWFDNSVEGQGLASEDYKSSGLTASIESGYTFKLGEDVDKNATYFAQPKIQVIYMGVKSDSHKETNGTNVYGDGDGNIQTRLGFKVFMNSYSIQDKGKERVFQPFVETNWIHNTQDFGVVMDGAAVKQSGAANIAELKVGVEGQINKQLNIWGNIAQQVGDKGYSDTGAMVGIKYNF
ncbi:autotransporter outer membrane beta-barrel domain-containing protein [Yersinia frederiksenii]|uniref:autotransporter outer membrane beta-barrel domain-containing protein n=1 Tax=Yersinia frederiksenii TaxID=29484 RepID=UPI0005E3D599|nr:autotransporter outer membrane beta-barrel domain-containing protein [Yersinia frederiksenii]CQJ04952.1 autotransporter protein [Yersinia frederiksenii]